MNLTSSVNIPELKAEFNSIEAEFPRRAAEIAYVLARLYRDAGKRELSEKYARKSVELFEQVGINTLEDAAAIYTVLADVCLPSYIHQDVVRKAFPEFRL
jgi:DNA topoisomerase IB